MTQGSRLRSTRQWLDAGRPRGVARADHLSGALLRHALTDLEVTAVVRALVLRTGHSVADPVPDDDITRLVESLVYIGADEDDIYRVRAAMREAGRSLVEHC